MARLLFVTGTPADVEGGSGTFVGISVLRRALLARGHAVDFLAPREGRFVSLAGRIAFNWRTRRAAALLAPDVVVGFDWDGLWLDPGLARSVAAIKGVLAEEARFERGIPRLRLKTESLLEARHARRVERVLATSAHSASQIVASYGVPPSIVRIVPEPIDFARWTDALRGAGDAPRDRPTILCVAHLYPRKDVDSLLRAMSRLGDSAALRVVGTGPERARLSKLARGLGLERRAEFLGHVSFDRLVEEYRAADLFCLPSRQEGFGIVFLEAMAASLPIVAAAAAAVPEVVVDGENGLLFTPGDDAALAGILARLVEDPALRRRLGDAGRRRVERYDADRVAGDFLEAIGPLPQSTVDSR